MLILLLISLLGFVIFLIISSGMPELLLVMMEVVVLSLGMVLLNVLYRRLFIILMAILITLTISFAFGFATGRAYLSDNDTPNIVMPSFAGDVVRLKSGETIGGRIIRSGDRGVMFYDPASGRRGCQGRVEGRSRSNLPAVGSQCRSRLHREPASCRPGSSDSLGTKLRESS